MNRELVAAPSRLGDLLDRTGLAEATLDLDRSATLPPID